MEQVGGSKRVKEEAIYIHSVEEKRKRRKRQGMRNSKTFNEDERMNTTMNTYCLISEGLKVQEIVCVTL